MVSEDLHVLHMTYSTGFPQRYQLELAETRASLQLTDILLQHVFDILLGVSTLDHQTVGPVHTSTRTQFGIDEFDEVLRLSSHTSADIGNVGEHGLLCAFSVDLGRYQGELFLVTGEFRVVRVQEGVESGEELRDDTLGALADDPPCDLGTN